MKTFYLAWMIFDVCGGAGRHETRSKLKATTKEEAYRAAQAAWQLQKGLITWKGADGLEYPREARLISEVPLEES